MKDAKHLSVRLKIEKANSLLAEIDVLVHYKFYSTAINRIYYACFHATKAVLLTKDIIPKTHSGVVAMLHKHFVSEALFDVGMASFFSRIMQERVDDDYSDHAVVSGETVSEYFLQAKEYIRYIQNLIEQIRDEH